MASSGLNGHRTIIKCKMKNNNFLEHLGNHRNAKNTLIVIRRMLSKQISGSKFLIEEVLILIQL